MCVIEAVGVERLISFPFRLNINMGLMAPHAEFNRIPSQPMKRGKKSPLRLTYRLSEIMAVMSQVSAVSYKAMEYTFPVIHAGPFTKQ